MVELSQKKICLNWRSTNREWIRKMDGCARDKLVPFYAWKRIVRKKRIERSTVFWLYNLSLHAFRISNRQKTYWYLEVFVSIRRNFRSFSHFLVTMGHVRPLLGYRYRCNHDIICLLRFFGWLDYGCLNTILLYLMFLAPILFK